MAKLGDVFPLVRNGVSIRQTDGATGIPITRIETISNREIDRNKFGYANIIDGSKYKNYILQDGDILMSHINSEKHLGKVALYRKQGNEQIIHGMNLLMLRANSSVLFPPYATYFFETPAFLMQIQKITKKSVNQASFTVTALKEIEIPLPPLDEQCRIAAVLDKVGGLIAKRLTDVSGSSQVFRGGVVSYTNEVKHGVLGVPQALLDQYGAVSEPVARAMAEGARQALGCDLALASTGVAGPDPDERGNPVGLVYLALAAPDGTWVRKIQQGLGRERVRHVSASHGFDLARRYLSGLEVK